MSKIAEVTLWTALVTPFDESGENVDYASLKQLINIQEDAGNGIVIFGSTGEGISLRTSEKQEMLKFVFDLKPSVPIMVGVPSHNLYEALEWLRFCKSFPVDAYLMTTPIYTKPGVIGQRMWFEKLLDHANAPAMLYNIPSRAGIKLHAETVKGLRDHSKFWAIKDSSGTVETLLEYKAAAPDAQIFCGDDNMMPSFAEKGAVGLVSVVSNVWPVATHKYVELCLKRELQEIEMWQRSAQAFFTASNPVPVKAFLHHLKLINTATVRLPLSAQDLESLEGLKAAHQDVTEWEKIYA